MIQNIYDFFVFSFAGLFKVVLFLFFFCFSIFFFCKSEYLSMDDNPAFAGLLVNPGGSELLMKGSPTGEPGGIGVIEPGIEDMNLQEAEIYYFIMRLSDSIDAPNARKLAKLIVEECGNYDKLDPYLVLAVIQVESEFSPKALSKKGAIGLMQVMPGTGEFMAKEMGIDYNGRKSLYDPFINVKLGIHYLSLLTERYDSTERALDAYNFGPANFEKTQNSDKTRSVYVKKVLNFKSYLEGESVLLARNT